MPSDPPNRDALGEFFAEFGKPGEPNYHNNQGTARRGAGDLDGAIREYGEAVRLAPEVAMFRCNLASALAEKGAHQEALAEYEQALRLEPGDYHTRFNLGNLLSKMGETEEAIAEYQRAIACDPERADARYNLAGCLWKQGRHEESAELYRQALAADADASVAKVAHVRLGSLHTEQEEWEKALTHLHEAQKRDPEDFLVHYILAVVYLNMPPGELPEWALRSKAVLHARKAIELDPEDDDAREIARAAAEAFARARPPE